MDNYGTVIIDESSPAFIGAKECTNNTAELSAIVEAMLWALSLSNVKDGVVHIFYGSKYAADNIMGANHPSRNRRLVYMGRIVREKLLHKHDIRWTWVKGHQGNVGNERADRLADAGREGIMEGARGTGSYGGRALFLMGGRTAEE